MDNFNHPFEGRGVELLPSAAHMRAECLQRAWDDVHTTFSGREQMVIQSLFCEAVERYAQDPDCDAPRSKSGSFDWRWHPGLAIINRDLEAPYLVSKWYLLASWLAPESAVTHSPDLVFTIAGRALAGKL